MDLDRLYLDYNATSPLSPTVKSWLASGDFSFANPSAQHMAGKESRKKISSVVTKIQEVFSLDKTDKVLFHSGATEGIFSVFHSFLSLARSTDKKLIVCYSPLDHAAVLKLIESSEANEVEFLKLSLNEDLSYHHSKNIHSLRELIKSHPGSLVLYHHLWVHNETGLVSDLEWLKDFKLLSPHLFIHVDSVQAPGKISSWKDLHHGDFWTYSAHKFGAFKGVGFTIIKNQAPFLPLFVGGGQQKGLRGGTENLMGIESIQYALADLERVDVEQTTGLKNRLKEFLKDEIQGLGAVIETPFENSNTIYFYLNRLTSDVTLALFDLNGLMISAGSACSSGASKPSAVLTELKKYSEVKNGLRISLPLDFTQDQLDKITERFKLPLERIRNLS